MKTFTKSDIKRFFVLIILFSPALMVEPVRDILRVPILGVQLPYFSVFLLLFGLFALPFLTIIFLKNTLEPFFLRCLISIFFFLILVLIDFLINDNKQSLYYLLTIVPPYIASFSIVAYLDRKELAIVLKQLILIFTVYLLINIFYWYLYLNPVLGASHGLNFKRMGGTLAPEVLLSYLITTLLPLVFYFYRVKKTRIEKNYIFWIILFVFILASILTGSRGGIWFAVLYIAAWTILNSEKDKNTFFIILLSSIIIFHIIPFSTSLIDRLSTLHDEGRSTSLKAGLLFFINSSLSEKFFGLGFGNVYPYLTWLQDGAQTWKNTFWLANYLSVVQPHNSFLWILVECGILGFILLFWPIIEILSRLFNIIQKRGSISLIRNKLGIWPMFIFLVMFNTISSPIVHTPHVAFLIWFLVFSFGKLEILNTAHKYKILTTKSTVST